jgi:branched-chain amino acid aminotransferase
MSLLQVKLATKKKEKPDQNKLGFGVHFTDHMLVVEYEEGKGWYDARIEPYGPISLDPSAMVLHYGQAVFEGLKAYRTDKNEILLFRPEKNIERLNRSNERLCIPKLDPAFVLDAMKQLVDIDRDWVPSLPGTSLYIRPFIFATEPHVGVHPSKTYKFIIILSPVGAYYPEGINPVTIYVEDKYVRAVRGGLGEAKTAANYAASLKAQMDAEKHHYTQVLWLDGVERKYVDEVGTMNVFFKIDNEIITPELNGTILPGITRDSCLQLLRSWGYKVSERRISIDEIYDAYKNGKLDEAFGSGTAAVISPIGELVWEDNHMEINHKKIGEVSQRLYDAITGIQSGIATDQFGWINKI